MKSSRKLFFGAVAVLLASTPLFGQVKVPVKNWTVPPFDASMFNQSGIGIRPLTHSQGDNPAVFVPFGPCRLTDSRVAVGGPGPIAGGGTRDYDFVGGTEASASGCPFISGLQESQTVSDPIVAWSLNFTVLNTAGPGFLVAYPTGGTFPAVSILNYTGAAGELRNNAAIVPVNAATGSFTVAAGVSATDVIIDVNGVFLAVLEPDTTLKITSNTAAAPAIWGSNTSNGGGVLGSSTNGFGVAAESGTWDGLRAFGGQDGGYLQGGRNGVTGVSIALSAGSAGVRGISGDNAALVAANAYWAHAGVSGSGTVWGVLGFSDFFGVGGFHHNPVGGALQTGSYLGFNSTVGLHTVGTTSATGAKAFVEPHPTDASKMIRYISLEGPEAGTYFRGRGRFQNGTARIEVPEDFRFVTDPEGLTVQITPIGAMATVAVLRMDLNEIVAQGSRNVEFSYLVQGVRHSFKDVQPIMENDAYRPISPEFRMPEGYAPEQKRILVENGTYRADGGVNMETATRLGWDKIWEKRNPPAPAPNPE